MVAKNVQFTGSLDAYTSINIIKESSITYKIKNKTN